MGVPAALAMTAGIGGVSLRRWGRNSLIVLHGLTLLVTPVVLLPSRGDGRPSR